MKITCPYCNNLFDDTLATCPHCSAPNSGVVRKSGGQPITIEELKAWYASKGLPPYEKTRFFIGENYTKPRAFGIYKDESTGNFVVYKNKDSGERAIRYQGTDEAYAVNELYQRLKQEIIQQKQVALKKKGSYSPPSRPAPARSSGSYPASASSGGKRRGRRSHPVSGCLVAILAPIAFFILLFIYGFIAVTLEDSPAKGYYSYDNEVYYRFINHNTTTDTDWFFYDDAWNEWSDPIGKDDLPKALKKNKDAKAYFLQEEYTSDLGVPDFLDSPQFEARMLQYYDKENHNQVNKGYYDYSGLTYYHDQDAYNSGWYYYDDAYDDWYSVDYDDVPDDLTHQYYADDFYYTPVWDDSTQITDFTDSQAYSDAHTYSSSSSSSSSSWDDDDDYDWGWDDDDDDYDWSWDSSDDWDWGGSDWDSDW